MAPVATAARVAVTYKTQDGLALGTGGSQRAAEAAEAKAARALRLFNIGHRRAA